MNIFNYIKDKIEIVEVVKQYTDLEEVNKDIIINTEESTSSYQVHFWRGICPLDKQKMHRLIVNRSRKFFYCPSSRKAGDVIDFIATIERCSSIEAVYTLAKRHNIELPKDYDTTRHISNPFRECGLKEKSCN